MNNFAAPREGSFRKQFTAQPVAELDLSGYVLVEEAQPVRTVIEQMRAKKANCALVTGPGAALQGIFTDRDLLMKVVGVAGALDLAVSAVMTPAPRTLSGAQTVGEALQIFNLFGFRNLPVFDGSRLLGSLGHRTLIARAHSLCAAHGDVLHAPISSIDIGRPVAVPGTRSLQFAIRTMQLYSIGCCLVTDAQDKLAGVFTEMDALLRVAGLVTDLEHTTVAEHMTASPATLNPEAEIAQALEMMGGRGFRHVPLVDAELLPVSVMSSRDILHLIEALPAV
ncbi:MAG: CBS domain-containing protein [Chloroflexi bacterium]|jgi:CBS domain-containing protein|nr:MAG: CBS domain-containing protein [Chloroflexota bacterium]